MRSRQIYVGCLVILVIQLGVIAQMISARGRATRLQTQAKGIQDPKDEIRVHQAGPERVSPEAP